MDIANKSTHKFYEKFGETIKFSALFRYVRSVKLVLYQKDIPHMSCLCDKCENLELLIDGINRCVPEYRNQKLPNNCHDLLPLVVCSPDFACASGDCQNCPNGINMEVIRNADMISVYQWGNSPGNKYPEKNFPYDVWRRVC